MNNRFIIMLWLTTVLSISAGCSPGPIPRNFHAPSDSQLIAGVPFYPDDTNFCGPSSLAAVMTFHGRPTTKEEVAKDVQRADLGGSLGPDLVLWARQQGFQAKFFSADPDDLIKYLNAQKPLILLVDHGFATIRKGHFLVAVGYNPDGLVANSGTIQQEIISWSTFLTQWLSLGYFAILVEPPEDLASSDNEGHPLTPELEVPSSDLFTPRPLDYPPGLEPTGNIDSNTL